MSSIQLIGYLSSNGDKSGELYNLTQPATSAFGEQITAENIPIIQEQFPYNIISDIEYIKSTSGAGSISAVDGKAKLSVVSGTDTAELTNKNYIRYRNGQGLLLRWTCYFDNFGSGTNGYIGYFDSQDGFIVGYNTTDGLFIIRRYLGTDTKVVQANFNCDILDGAGESAFNYDPTLGNVFQLSFQWLGYGMITFSIENPETGGFIPFHKIKYANTSPNTSVRNPSLQFNMLIESAGNAGDLYCPSIAVFNQGPLRLNGALFSSENTVNVSGTPDPVLAIRNKATFNSLTNRSPIVIKLISCAYIDTGNCIVNIIANPTITGGAWNDVDTNETPVEDNKTMTGYSGGRTVASFTLTDYDKEIIQFKDFATVLQPGDSILVVFDSTGGSGNALSSIAWRNDW